MLIGFQGTHNASCLLVQALSGDCALLTNSLAGVQRDIAALDGRDGYGILFGVDKTLQEEVRIEAAAAGENGEKRYSQLDLTRISDTLTAMRRTGCFWRSSTAKRYCCTSYSSVLQRRVCRAHAAGVRHVAGDCGVLQRCSKVIGTKKEDTFPVLSPGKYPLFFLVKAG